MQYVTGKLLTENGFVPGHLGFEDGVISEVGKGQRRDALAKGLIIPSMFDAHTHLGDSFLGPKLRRFKGDRSVPALFAPPHGFKHRELAKAGEGTGKKGCGDLCRSKISSNRTSAFGAAKSKPRRP